MAAAVERAAEARGYREVVLASGQMWWAPGPQQGKWGRRESVRGICGRWDGSVWEKVEGVS